MECLLPYLCIVTIPLIMVGMLDYRGVGLVMFHCMYICMHAMIFSDVCTYHYVSS